MSDSSNLGRYEGTRLERATAAKQATRERAEREKTPEKKPEQKATDSPKEAADAPKGDAETPKEAEPDRDSRLEVDHKERIREARGSHALMEKVTGFFHEVVTQVVERVAVIAANHLAPGIGGHIVHLAVQLKNALGNIENLAEGGDIELQIPLVSVDDGSFGIWVGPTLSTGEDGEDTIGIDAGPAVGIYEPLTVGKPEVEVADPPEEETHNKSADIADIPVERNEARGNEPQAPSHNPPAPSGDLKHDSAPPPEVPDRPRRGLEALFEAFNLTSPEVSRVEGPRSGSQEHERARPRSQEHTEGGKERGEHNGEGTGEQPAISILALATDPQVPVSGNPRTESVGNGQVGGAVVYGSAAAITAWAGTPVLTAGVLLRYARSRLFDLFYDGTPASVRLAYSRLRSLEVLVFLDVTTGVGLWVDVDPLAQAPAVTLLIKIDSHSDGGRVHLFRYCP